MTGTSSKNLRKWATCVAIFSIVVAAFRWLDTIKHRWYVLDPEMLHQVAQDAIAASPNSTAGMIDHIVANLTSTYSPKQIRFNTDTSEWVFNNAGGAMGAMYIIHASITEYLIIYGTPLGTEGHSGQHTADDYFNILVGEEWFFYPGELEMRRFPAGSVNHLPRGKTAQYKMHKGCFALEYAVGWIPPMLPFGFADTFTSTLDYVSLWNTVKWSAREMIGNLLIGKI
ncbi:C-8 sterol isomerase [Marasmius tenuissimus]|nr:C-8 sterol isomerase [Marasmius tenuissimus]